MVTGITKQSYVAYFIPENTEACKIYDGWMEGWCSSESTRLPPMCPGFAFQSRRHMWVEFVGSLLCTEEIFSGYSGFPSPQKQTFGI